MVFTSFAKTVVERMISGNSENFMNTDEQKLIKQLFVLAIWLVVTLFVGKFLWNSVAVKVFTVVKPLTSIWQLLAIALLLDLIHPTCC